MPTNISTFELEPDSFPDPLKLFIAVSSSFRALWIPPGTSNNSSNSYNSSKALVGIGIAQFFSPENLDEIQTLPSHTILLGSIPFQAPSDKQLPKWENFKTGRLILPEILVIYEAIVDGGDADYKKGTVILQVAKSDHQSMDEVLFSELKDFVGQDSEKQNQTTGLLNIDEGTNVAPTFDNGKQKAAPIDFPQLKENDIQAAISKIQKGQRLKLSNRNNSPKKAQKKTQTKKNLAKVVLANCQQFQTSDSTTAERLLEKLNKKYPSCARFAFAYAGNTCEKNDVGEKNGAHKKHLENEEIFFGATPELLIKMDNSRFETSALAGTIPSGDSSDSSDTIADTKKTQEAQEEKGEKSGESGVNLNPDFNKSAIQTFLQDEKERSEHRFVVDQLVETLTSLGAELEPISPIPEIRELPNILHLQTEITGQINRHILECVVELAPTSAVAGIPTEKALAFINKTEQFNRGGYSGAVGWCTPTGNGEFFTALRSALFVKNEQASICELFFFAGAGIVADSKSKEELEEIELKMNAIKGLL